MEVSLRRGPACLLPLEANREELRPRHAPVARAHPLDDRRSQRVCSVDTAQPRTAQSPGVSSSVGTTSSDGTMGPSM